MNVYKEIKRDVVWIIAFVFLLTLVLNFFKVGLNELLCRTTGERHGTMVLRRN